MTGPDWQLWKKKKKKKEKKRLSGPDSGMYVSWQQAPVARKVNSAIHQISPIQRIKFIGSLHQFYPLDKTYPVDSTIDLSCTDQNIILI